MRVCLLWTFGFLIFGIFGFSCGGPVERTSVDVSVQDEGPRILHLNIKILPGPGNEVVTKYTGSKLVADGRQGSTEAADETDEVPEAVDEVEATPEPPPTQGPDCVWMSQTFVDIYETCQFEKVAENCYTKPECPKACTAENGTEMALGPVMWTEEEGKKMCECSLWHDVSPYAPIPPPGAGDLPLFKHCVVNGCEPHGGDENSTIIEVYGNYTGSNGLTCVCVRGPDPYLMDYNTMFHLQCETAKGPPADAVSDEQNETDRNQSCIWMSSSDAEYFGTCKLEKVSEDCYTKPECPTTCTAENGTEMAMDEPMWPELDGRQMCECVTWGSLFFFPIVPPPGAGPYPPYKHCQTNGCEIETENNTTMIEEGDNHTRNDGATCVCVKGTDPELMDASTLFHLQCEETKK